MWHEEGDNVVLDCGEEAVPFFAKKQVYIVPVYALTFLVDLPIRPPGQTFSNWDIREKIKSFVSPHELKDLKVAESSDCHIKFTAHVLNIDIMDEVITTLDNITFRAPGFESALKVSVKVGGYPYPKPEDWAKYFKGSKLNQEEPGERPDTIHISGLPYEWFAPNISDDVSAIMINVMSQYGKIRQIDIPQEDPYRSEMEKAISGMQLNWFHGSHSPFFEMYVQYEEYEGFYNAMTKMGGHQLVRRAASSILSEYQFTIKFDKTGHLSNKSVIRRELSRQMLIQNKRQKEIDDAQRLKEMQMLKEKLTNSADRKALEAKIKAGIEQSEKQRELDEEVLRRRLKDKKKHQAMSRILESENLIKFLLADEVTRIEWEKNHKNNANDLIKEYARQLPQEDLLRRKLIKNKEIEMRSNIAKKRFDVASQKPSTSTKWKPIGVAETITNELTTITTTPHEARKRIHRDYRSRRSKLIKQIDSKLQKYRSKFREDPYFDRTKMAVPEATKQIPIVIKTKCIQELLDKDKSKIKG